MGRDSDEIPKSISKRFGNLDYEDDPKPRPKKKRAARPPAPAPPPEERVSPAIPARPLGRPMRPRGRQPGPLDMERGAPPGPSEIDFHRVGVALDMDPPDGVARGVRIQEVDLGRGRRGAPRTPAARPTPEDRGLTPGVWPEVAPPEAPGAGVERDPPPITVDAEAARQFRLMAHYAGCAGYGLRLLTSESGRGRPDVDFALEAAPEPDDVVIQTQGLAIFVDRRSLERVEGLHISLGDLPPLDRLGVRRR